METLEAAPDVGADLIQSLRLQVERQLRSTWSNKQEFDQRRLMELKQKAQVEAVQREVQAELNQQLTDKEMLNRLQNLFGVGDYRAAEAMALAVLERNPVNVAASAAQQMAALIR